MSLNSAASRPPQHRAAVDEDADARAFEAFAQQQDPLDVAAATWATRRRNGLDAQSNAELQEWLAADPRHADALADMDETFGEVGELPHGEVASLRTALPARPAPAPPRRAVRDGTPWWTGWPRMVPQTTIALVLALALGAGWLGWDRWQRQPTFAQAFATERGQQRSVTLPDAAGGGSTLQLDTATRLEARLYRGHREVRLADGQAMFSVHADPARPFHVLAGQLRITVVGTRFSVRHTASGIDAGKTVVSVEEGHVRVSPSAPDGAGDALAPVELSAGLMVVAGQDGRIGPATPVATAAIAPWRSGRISFEHTPLRDALAEFERYGRTGLVVRDPAVAALPVGGSYNLRQFQHFARALPEILPVRLVPAGELTEIVAR
ncbi:FecR domain-containing protein [Pseudorhodoferax sp. LjRoot39]|uniref:FecR family protein n=1 Tax=Pseudorhodoferax sp. LjRoot39 TaxID=3342328 RepID=UPI003ED02CBA